MSESKESSSTPVTVFVISEKSSLKVVLGAVRKSAGPFFLVIGSESLVHLSDQALSKMFSEARALNPDRRLLLATKDARILAVARATGWQCIENLKELTILLRAHPSLSEAVRAFSPVSWRRDIRSRLQMVGLLSLPKLRIWLLLVVSIVSFGYVFFRFLPSATIRIWSNQETETFTTNVYLVESGAVIPVPTDRVKSLPLRRLTVHIDRTITYDQISKNFTGTNAEMTVTVFNDSDESYSLRKGTRLVNQAGMRFRLQNDLTLASKTKQDMRAVADPIDQYGEVLGDRGNVPSGVKWDFLGLSERERALVYARNDKPASGGTTSYVNVLSKDDIFGSQEHPGAKQRLEQELLMVARQQVEDERIGENAINGTNFVQLKRDDLTKIVYGNFQLSESFVGQNVTSVPVSGGLDYTVVLYDEDALLDILKGEAAERVPSGKTILQSSLSKENMDLYVIPPWDDDLLWVKITADLTYSERYVLNPLTPAGAKFAKYIRDNVSGKDISEAKRIIKNLPEVSKVEISLWPPWTYQLPGIGSSIAVVDEQD